MVKFIKIIAFDMNQVATVITENCNVRSVHLHKDNSLVLLKWSCIAPLTDQNLHYIGPSPRQGGFHQR